MSIFHAYDIRGVYGKELTASFAHRLGYAILKHTVPSSIVIGYDSRISSPALYDALTKSITAAGRDVISVGLVTRPMLNWIAATYKYDLGIMITASHNPKEYNGFKFLWKGKPLSYTAGLNAVEKLMKHIRPFSGKTRGKIIERSYTQEYIAFLSQRLHVRKPIRIVADASNGTVGALLESFFKKNTISYTLINRQPDGTFPCHDPNPMNASAMKQLTLAVKKHDADFGVIFDPDADRVRFVDENGTALDTNAIACLVIEELLKKNPRASIVHDIIARRVLTETIVAHGGKAIASKVGSSFISTAMRKHHALFGCEVSGHHYFKEFHNLDSGLLMMAYVMNVFDSRRKPLSTLIRKYDRYYVSPELTVPAHGDIVSVLKKYFGQHRARYAVTSIDTLDGVRIVCKQVWFTVRSSNTEPIIRIRIEGLTKKAVEEMRDLIKGLISDYVKRT